jgi:Ser/Thr protein kinase RdoA (MazF antagonist)
VADHADFAGLIPDVIGRFGLWPQSEPVAVPGGTLNWNFRIETDGGSYFVRRYRDNLETERIKGEHELLRWAEERGVPVALPEETPDDLSLVQIAGGRWAIFPWIDGGVRPRGSLSSGEAQTLGALHGYVQSVLAQHPTSDGARMKMTWDKAQSIELLGVVAAAAERSGAEGWIRDGIAKQHRMLDGLEVLTPEAFASLPVQLLHGDFHDQQVIWQGDAIAALVDWEIWHCDPRAWELVRSLAFSLLLDSPLLEDYLRGYRHFVQLSEDECRLGLRLWWQSRVVGLWAWRAHFLEGNERVKDFFPAMISELDNVADEQWKSSIEERFVRAARG